MLEHGENCGDQAGGKRAQADPEEALIGGRTRAASLTYGGTGDYGQHGGYDGRADVAGTPIRFHRHEPNRAKPLRLGADVAILARATYVGATETSQEGTAYG